MAADKNQIVSRALVKLGARAVINVEDDDTPESRIMLNIYDMALGMITSETLWTFATVRMNLATLSGTIPFVNDKETGLNYIYQRPTDIVRLFSYSDDGAYVKEEGDTLLSDTSGLGILYTRLVTDTSLYHTFFATAFSDLLAAEAAFPILNSRSKAEDLMGLYEKISLPKAISQNAQIGTPKVMNDNYWVNARFAGPNVQEHS